MKPELLTELRKIRNEIAHGVLDRNSTNFAKRLSGLGVSIPDTELPEVISIILEAYGGDAASYYIPQILIQVIGKIVEGQAAAVVCDPLAGLGALMATIRDATHAHKSLAFAQNESEALLGKVLAGTTESLAMEPIQWQVGDPLQLLSSLKVELDVVASVLPFGATSDRPLALTAATGETVELRDDLGSLILAAAATRLSSQGIGLFVVSPSFFFTQRSVLHQFDVLGLGIEAALALPPGSFAPYTNISTYLVVVRKRPASRMFVAQLSSDANTNLQIIANLKQGREGGALELGRFVDVLSFKGLDSIRLAERFEQAERNFGARAVRLEELATAVTLGRFGENCEFPKQDNVVFIPLIGISDAVDSLDDLTLKRQNYAQVAIDPARSDARFVARFLNSELGKEIRDLNKTGANSRTTSAAWWSALGHR